MTEKVQINNKDVWIVVEPHATQPPEGELKEYFTASYYLNDPGSDIGGVLLLDDHKRPFVFDSPVQALEHVNEKLLGLI